MHIAMLLLLFCLPAAAQLKILAVTTAAGYLPGITKPGGISTIFCTGLTGISGVKRADGLPLPTTIMGVRVFVFGIPAPLLSVSDLGAYQQINFLVPNLPDFVRTPLTVDLSQFNNSTGIKMRDRLFNGYPADLFRDPAGFGIVQHASDYSLVTRQSPALRGELVIAYATGMGAVEPPLSSGSAAPLQPTPALILYPGEPDGIKLFLCNPGPACEPQGQRILATALFAGLSPGNVGVYQINFRIPDNAPTGEVEFGVRRFYCYDAPCTLMSPFADVFESQRVKLAIQ